MRTSFIYLIALVIGLLTTPFAMKAAYIQRGYFAIGGELLIPILFLSLASAWIELRQMFHLENAKENRRHKKSTHRSAQTKIISLN
jgi:hypothetical protein